MNPNDRIAQLNAAMEKYKSSNNNEFFTLENDKDMTTVRFLYENEQELDWFVVHEVTIGGKKRWLQCPETPTCPCCVSGNKPQLKLFLQLVDKRDGKIKTWERGQKFVSQILGLFTSYGPICNRPYDVERNGKKGDTNTTYATHALNPDNMTLAGLKDAGFERQQLLGEDAFILQKSESDMQKIMNGTYQYQRVDNPAPRTGGAFGGGPAFGDSNVGNGGGQQQQQQNYNRPSGGVSGGVSGGTKPTDVF